jgi:hypothetical protein
MLPLTLVSFHLGLAFGLPWSPTLEARLLAAYLLFTVVWDLLWFLLNPHYGWRRFRKGAVWWHDRQWLVRFPIDYWNALALSFLVAALPRWLAGNRAPLIEHAVHTGGLLLLTGLAAALAPLYQRWYRHMRRPGSDERHLVRR